MRGLPESKIPFATHAWCLATGCTEDLPCAPNCWAKRDAQRMANNGCEEIARRYRGLVKGGTPGSGVSAVAPPPHARAARATWTGRINEFPEFLDAPGRLREPAVIFVGTHTDLGLCSADLVQRAFAQMAVAGQRRGHQFLVVTKRWPLIHQKLGAAVQLAGQMTNVTVCVSAGTQAEVSVRLGQIRDLSSPWAWLGRIALFLEPQLEAVDLRAWAGSLSWVVQGCETLSRTRPGRPFEWEWADRVSEQCRRAGVPYWLKQAPGWVCPLCRQWTREEDGPCGDCDEKSRWRLVHNPWVGSEPSQEAPGPIAEILTEVGAGAKVTTVPSLPSLPPLPPLPRPGGELE